MPPAPSTNAAIPNKYCIPLYLVLIAAGLAGNYFKFQIFPNIDFIFGSIFALLALQFLGVGRGITAAAIIAGYTYILWNHPYAIVFLTAEVAVVGWLMSRRRLGLVLADTLYWLVIGMPLAYLFYHFIMHVPFSNTSIVMIKLAANGIANALVARLIFTGYAHSSRMLLISYREIVYNLLAFFVLCPVLIILAVESRAVFNETDLRIRRTLIQNSQRVDQHLEMWVDSRKSAILNLAEMASSKTTQQMQSSLEQAKRSDTNFQRVGLLDRQSTTTAFYPPVDEQGHSNIGKNFADRPYILTLKRTLRPMLSEVVMGRIGPPKPIVLILAPVVIRGEYGGLVSGILGLEQIREHLDKSIDEHASFFTLTDKNGNVIMTNRADQTVMTPFKRGKGALNTLDKDISQWVPAVPPNTPFSERWRQSFYVAETSIGNLAEWKLILEQPVAPFQKALYDSFTNKLILLFLILLGALALAEYISRKIVATLGQLRTLTYELPARLATDGTGIEWPESGIKETNHLINNFREMANTLSEQFFETQQINESLEQRVKERTKELRKSEEAYRQMTEDVSDVVWKMDRDLRFIYVGPADERLRGYPANEVIGHTIFETLTEEGIATIKDKIRQRQEAERNGIVIGTVSFEAQQFCRDGRLIWTEIVSTPERAADGTITGFHGIGRDITARKRAEEQEQFRSRILEFMAGDEPLQSILEAIAQGLEKLNPAMLCSILLLDLEGRHLVMGAAPSLPDFYNSAIDGIQIGMGVGSCGTAAFTGERVIVGDIATHPYWAPYKELAARAGLGSCWSEPILSSSNQVLGTFAIYHHESRMPAESDISIIEQASRLASIAIEKRVAEEKLRDSEERFRSLLENIPNLAVQGYALDGTVLFWNRASELLYGYSAKEALKSDLLDLIIPPEMREGVAEAILQMKESGEPIPASELLLMRKDGSRVPVLSSHALFRPLGRQPELFCLDIDLTERKQAEEELHRAKYAAEAANIAKSQFLATMSHEIRTPMNGVIGMIELLQHTKLTREQNKYAERAKCSGIELVHLLNDILDLSKIEADKLELESSDFDLRPVISDTINLLLLSAREKGVKLTSSIDIEVPTALKGDTGRLRQILTNLIGNAIKFTPNGSVTLQTRKDAEDERSATLRFLVNDSGIGIAADKLEHIFEPFTQADSSTTRTHGGTGLGLAICKRLAELMGGSVGAESSEGVGSTFWFTVVMEKQNITSPSLPPPTSHLGPLFAAPLLKGEASTSIRILLTEDDHNAQMIVPKLLKFYGYQVDVAGNGKEALQALEKIDYALVLMDCMMPEMNGFEVTAAIRDPASAVRHHDIPVIALTGNAMKQDREKCLAAGMDDHLPKPLLLPDMLAMLEKWLKGPNI